jgi:hypothetical protein
MSGFIFVFVLMICNQHLAGIMNVFLDTLYSILILEFDYYMCLSLISPRENSSRLF